MSLTHRALQHRGRALVALLALALAALGLGACGSSDGGGGSGGSTADAQALLTQAIGTVKQIKSGKLNLQLSVASSTTPAKVTVTGPFETAASGQLPKADLSLDVSGQGQAIKAGLISTGDRLFVDVGGTAYEVPATVLASFKQGGGKQVDPSVAIGGALGLVKDPKVVGTDTVGGVESEHITGQLDVQQLIDDLDQLLAQLRGSLPAGIGGTQIPDHITAAQRKQIEDAIKSATIQVWTGKDDHILRKLSVALTLQPPKGSGADTQPMDVTLTIELDDLNAPQTIETPSDVRPLSELLGQLQGLLGGSGLGAGAFGGSGSGSGSSAQVDKYAQCLQDAGGDASKIQQCASLLTK